MNNDIEAAVLLEDARTGLVRSARFSRSMLSDALHAVRNGSTDVAAEYIERVLDSLDSALSVNDDNVAALKA